MWVLWIGFRSQVEWTGWLANGCDLELWAIGTDQNNNWLWMLTNGVPSVGADSARAVFVSYIKDNPHFLTDQGYNAMWRGDMTSPQTGSGSIWSGNPNPNIGTQHFPDGQVSFYDVTYFVSTYILCNGVSGKVNPYGDLTSPSNPGNPDGQITFEDVAAFIANYNHYTGDGVNPAAPQSHSSFLSGQDAGLDTQPAASINAVFVDGQDNVLGSNIALQSDAVNQTVAVMFKVSNASDLWGLKTEVSWNSSVLAFAGAVSGDDVLGTTSLFS